jgi:hypothetical protein
MPKRTTDNLARLERATGWSFPHLTTVARKRRAVGIARYRLTLIARLITNLERNRARIVRALNDVE